MPYFPGIGHFSEHPHSADHRSQCSSGADYRHSDPTHCHPEADSALSGYYITSWAPHSYPTRAITGPSFTLEAEAAKPSSPHHPPATIWSFWYFLFIFPLCISFMYFLYEIPCFWYYILGLLVLLALHFVLTWIEVIQIYYFFLSLLALFYSYFLYSYLFFFFF